MAFLADDGVVVHRNAEQRATPLIAALMVAVPVFVSSAAGTVELGDAPGIQRLGISAMAKTRIASAEYCRRVTGVRNDGRA